MKIDKYNFPDNLYYHPEHSWARVESMGDVWVGMDDFFVNMAGEIVYTDLPKVGEEVEQGMSCGKVNSRKWIGELFAPISGEVVEVNQFPDDKYSAINDDPYGKGWLIKIRPFKAGGLCRRLKNLFCKCEPIMDRVKFQNELYKLLQDEAQIRPWIEGEIQKQKCKLQ